jgi:putative methyltransferase (TIGR04325 family)
MNSKKFIKDWLPPILYRSLSRLSKSGIQFEGNYSSWEEASSHCSGYDSEHILEKVLEATLKVKNGEAVFERDSVLFYEPEYVWAVLSGLLLAATQNQGKLNVLDFGGALGSTYFQHRKFLGLLQEVRWNIIEQSGFVEIGKNYIQDTNLRFYSTIEECASDNNINVILLSSVLQYLSCYITKINELIKVNSPILILDKTIINKSKIDYIYIQKTPASIYKAKYPCRSISEERLLRLLSEEYETISLFDSINFQSLKMIDSYFKGGIFKKVI